MNANKQNFTWIFSQILHSTLRITIHVNTVFNKISSVGVEYVKWLLNYSTHFVITTNSNLNWFGNTLVIVPMFEHDDRLHVCHRSMKMKINWPKPNAVQTQLGSICCHYRYRSVISHPLWLPNRVFVDFSAVNTLRPRQNGRHFSGDTFKCIFLNEKFEFWLRFHWSLHPRVELTIYQHWFR